MLPAPGGVSPVHLTDSVSKASYDEGAAMVYIQPTNLQSLRERTEHLDIFLFRPSLNSVLFPMFCLLVEGECQILVF